MGNQFIWIAKIMLVASAIVTVSAVEAKTFVYCSEGSPENFGPPVSVTETSFDAIQPFTNRLVEFKAGTTEIVPALAQSWSVSPDGNTYTFQLRQGVKWQSNAIFTPSRFFGADDVIWTFERQWKKDHPYYNVTSGDHVLFRDMYLDRLLLSISRLDEHTVKFTLNAPSAPFLANLATGYAGIQSAEYADTLSKLGKPELIDKQPIGTGPFSFVKYDKDAAIHYRKFNDYWGKKAKVDDLVFLISPEWKVRERRLIKNECQMASYPNLANIENLKANKALKVDSRPGLNTSYIFFNLNKGPLGDVQVRRALSMAINKEAIVSSVYHGTGIPANGFIPPALWGYSSDIKGYPYDPAAAKRLLAKAGYPGGFSSDFWVMPGRRPYNPDGVRVGEMIKADLLKVGVKVEIKDYKWDDYYEGIRSDKHMMAGFGWANANGDPDNFFTVLGGCVGGKPSFNNIANWCNEEFQRVVREATLTRDIGKRISYYREAQVIMRDQVPLFFIAHSIVYLPMRANVDGFRMSPFGVNDFSNVSLK